MKPIALILILFYTVLYADKNITVRIKGDLDDDLFILRGNLTTMQTTFLDCLQMHNPSDYFLYEGRAVPSKKIYGLIDFEKSYRFSKEDVMLIMSANEREEINPAHTLLQRTHFKSVALFIDHTIFIPSLMPEYDDVPGYPLWFGKDEKPLMMQKSDYNYYKLWENCIVNLGIVVGSKGKFRLYFTDKNEKIIFYKTVWISEKVHNIKLLGTHPLTEVDGTVYHGSESADKSVRERAIEGIIVEKEGKRVFFRLPYPFVYVNRIFIKGV
jgi:hypothetical protein